MTNTIHPISIRKFKLITSLYIAKGKPRSFLFRGIAVIITYITFINTFVSKRSSIFKIYLSYRNIFQFETHNIFNVVNKA